MANKLSEYRQAQKQLESEVTAALAAVIGNKAARQLVKADMRKAIGALSAFDNDAAKGFKHKLGEHEASFAGVGRAEATARAEAIARGLFAAYRTAGKYSVKLTLPAAIRVKVFGQSYRFALDYDRGQVVYAPIKRAGKDKGSK